MSLHVYRSIRHASTVCVGQARQLNTTATTTNTTICLIVTRCIIMFTYVVTLLVATMWNISYTVDMANRNTWRKRAAGEAGYGQKRGRALHTGFGQADGSKRRRAAKQYRGAGNTRHAPPRWHAHDMTPVGRVHAGVWHVWTWRFHHAHDVIVAISI